MVQNILRLGQNENIGLVYYSNYEVELLEKYLTAREFRLLSKKSFGNYKERKYRIADVLL
ncbi:hypothetical protein ATZ36_05920 [Candidatus Endomicrobiellum trichonymphae]|jgi:hypothetical protein|uniref:Uncharacterized protein n=1 Tax=Endomicrobium trichonymphae TaxID=1408204 RepID=A0A1E5II25_ENDTX|nr:hypothetical protein ATZ36_05920 [Candidatus Endomicrobium trichonymphae]